VGGIWMGWMGWDGMGQGPFRGPKTENVRFGVNSQFGALAKTVGQLLSECVVALGFWIWVLDWGCTEDYPTEIG